jgi:hypothetical protein
MAGSIICVVEGSTNVERAGCAAPQLTLVAEGRRLS